MVESVKHSATYALDAKHKYIVELFTEIAMWAQETRVIFRGIHIQKRHFQCLSIIFKQKHICLVKKIAKIEITIFQSI